MAMVISSPALASPGAADSSSSTAGGGWWWWCGCRERVSCRV